MTALLDASDSQMATLADLAGALQVAEQTIARMQAARDGMLAMASRLALDIAREAHHPDHGDMTIRAVAAEIGAAQRVSDRTVERRMDQAAWLVEAFPAVWTAQGAGRIGAAQARVIVDAGAHLDDPLDREAYTLRVLEVAEVESPNRLRRSARRIAEQFQARSLTERHRDARELRRVWVKDLDDGMAELGLRGPAALVHGMHDRLSQMAHAVRAENRERSDASDVRSIDQLRADLLADITLTAAPTAHDTAAGLLSAIQARVEVTVPVMTLMGTESDEVMSTPPAELDGRSPIDTETARLLAGGVAGWERVLTHPISGALLAVDRYRPSDQLKRHLRARDQRCRFPGCAIVARKCDIDHNHAASIGGATCADNLAHFCRRHHMLKHHSPWHVEQRTSSGETSDVKSGDGATAPQERIGGMLVWTSPTGTTYIDRPPSQNTVRFVATDNEPRFR